MEAEVLAPDEWLQRHVQSGRGTVCLRGRLEVYFPMTHPNAQEEYRRLYEAVAGAFGGATAWSGEGAWCRQDVPCQPEGLEKERVQVIVAAHNCTDSDQLHRVVDAIRQAARRTEQTAVGIAGTSRFYIIPTEEL